LSNVKHSNLNFIENVQIDHHYAQCITEPFEQTSRQILVHKSGVKIVWKTFLTNYFEIFKNWMLQDWTNLAWKCHLVTLCVKVATTFLGALYLRISCVLKRILAILCDGKNRKAAPSCWNNLYSIIEWQIWRNFNTF
jgi:hypothetical protein